MVMMVVDRGRRAQPRVLATRRRREKIKVHAKICAYNASQIRHARQALGYVYDDLRALRFLTSYAMAYFIRAATVEDVVRTTVRISHFCY